jgi:formylglycine-generating enzyme required for sulfatase activity/tRNA A-37 threonylcarbamoyl transferase component Bud32
MGESDFLIDSVLDGQYQIVEMLGKGGMATVYKAIQTSVNRLVAVKILPQTLLHDENFMKRFRQEAEVIARLEHFHILPIYDYGEYEGMPYIVMRYLEGGTLQDRVKKYGPLPWDEILLVTRQVAGALDYAHARNVVHRDVKPSNILLDGEGNAYLVDFGIAKMTESTAHLTGSGIVGTPAYMAPEQSQPGPPLPSMDVYALGVTIFEMMTGQQPYRAETPIAQIMMHIQNPIPSLQDFDTAIPPEVDEVVGRALAKDPAERYASAGELAHALEAAVASAGGWESSADTMIAMEHRAGGYADSATPQPSPPIASATVRGDVPSDAAGRKAGGLPGWVLPVAGVGGLLALLVIVGLAIGASRIFGGGNGGAQAEANPTGQSQAALAADQPTATDAPAEAPVEPTATLQEAAVAPTDAPAPAEEEPTAEPTIQASPTPLGERITLRGVPMLLVPAGPFTMGDDEGYPRERPAHEVTLDAYYIDETEVTNLYYMACVDAGGCAPPEFTDSPSQVAYYGAEYYHDYPVIFLNWDEAQNYCRWRGGHLPTEAQWEKAARWEPDTGEVREFPWDAPVIDQYYLNYGSLFGHTVEVESYEPGRSPIGAYQMGGNVAEWVYDWYQDNYYEVSPSVNPTGPAEGEFKVFRGGSYESSGSSLKASFRDYTDPLNKLATMGFRCAFTPSGDPTANAGQ